MECPPAFERARGCLVSFTAMKEYCRAESHDFSHLVLTTKACRPVTHTFRKPKPLRQAARYGTFTKSLFVSTPMLDYKEQDIYITLNRSQVTENNHVTHHATTTNAAVQEMS